LAKRGLARVEKALASKKYGVVILDEINVALKFKLVELKDVLRLFKKAPPKTEIILTGRDAPRELIEIADLVSDIKEVKHYYAKGIKARKGIEF
jgi:cob(I)alamin adenosyltransferase